MKSFLISILILTNLSSYAMELTESKAMTLFMERNLEIAASKYNIELSKADELTAGLWSNPSVQLDTQLNPFGKNWNQKTTGGPSQQDVLLTIPVDLNGKRRQAVRVARLATKGAEADFLFYLRSVLYGMLDSLYRVQRLEREHELLQEKVQMLEKLIITLEKRIGSATNQPLLQSRAKLAYENAKVEIQKNAMDRNEEENKLRTYLVIDSTDEITPNISFKTQFNEKLNPAELVKYAKENRPDFQSMKFMQKQLHEQSDLDHRKIWADIGILAGISRQDEVGKRPDLPQSTSLPAANSWLLGVTIPIPVFDRNQGHILQTKLLRNQVLVKERFMEETLSKDVQTSVKKIEITNLNLNLYRTHQLDNAKTVRDSATRQFGTGSTTLIEYLDAVDAYHNTILNYINAQYDLTSELLKLKLISGQEVRL